MARGSVIVRGRTVKEVQVEETARASGLAPNWQPVWSEENQRYYFWNAVTNETTWEQPISDVEYLEQQLVREQEQIEREQRKEARLEERISQDRKKRMSWSQRLKSQSGANFGSEFHGAQTQQTEEENTPQFSELQHSEHSVSLPALASTGGFSNRSTELTELPAMSSTGGFSRRTIVWGHNYEAQTAAQRNSGLAYTFSRPRGGMLPMLWRDEAHAVRSQFAADKRAESTLSLLEGQQKICSDPLQIIMKKFERRRFSDHQRTSASPHVRRPVSRPQWDGWYTQKEFVTNGRRRRDPPDLPEVQVSQKKVSTPPRPPTGDGLIRLFVWYSRDGKKTTLDLFPDTPIAKVRRLAHESLTRATRKSLGPEDECGLFIHLEPGAPSWVLFFRTRRWKERIDNCSPNDQLIVCLARGMRSTSQSSFDHGSTRRDFHLLLLARWACKS
eukprot:gnl/TRDRNA2_/TRDRNA2_139163_c0_seq2.p1 gnl/TRDRNA2_/TRDRNA2_139163_c0~~gnl/TRDRNA2_/TRDRNA2_139163_c0_seq2.p1  ORF type:complete len:444 (-),score=45.24 gnl/TRDRNA2_/TRDRNA2_139163_c0_seq2:281-1612(-)